MQINKILIANRGEVALRVIRTCKEMSIKTVALCPVKGQEDDFLETKLADEFYYLGKEGVAGYLDQSRIIEIAKISKADAIHPGYGFLAENSEFVKLCKDNQIKFIGPNSDTLKKLGDKIEAKKIARKCGIPILPSTLKECQNEKECKEMVKTIGLPCLLKAVDGGGGIGIDIIDKRNEKQLFAIFEKLKRVSLSAFGSGRIFVEKFLIDPRHIEFQVIGDGKGNAVHLFERECSIQRRHQKLIEEAPSSFLGWKLRKRMGNAAVKIIKYLKYEGVATVEFLVDSKKNYYFGEVNPRLQVEHPVTELITGIDLVEQQIKIAKGEKLQLKQHDIKMNGWAMEFRICAEDPANNFVPQSGKISEYIVPGGKGVEVHSFCRGGQKIFPYFDSLISKMVVYAKDRNSVIKRAKRAFDEYIINGLITNLSFHKTVLENDNFIKGNLSTSFIDKEDIVAQTKKNFKKVSKKRQIKGKMIDQEDLAYIIANVYKESAQSCNHNGHNDKWNLSNRMQIFE
ncbi:ATP-grasp domain-containing protein [Candidatus Parcubacteria bacterium]|nr:ATP-grasp domain-containing protein [Candidatus Parcubacteria bacterium]